MDASCAEDFLRIPDPTLSANIYAASLLNELLQRAVGPFWCEALEISHNRTLLWTLRYVRRGEHLKIRIHAPCETREHLQRSLENYVRHFFDEVRAVPLPPRIVRSDVPTIDFEDELESLAPDRSLIWTTYRRSHVSLAGVPWLKDDLLVAHSCKCLGSGCEVMLNAMKSDPNPSTEKAQKLLLKLLCEGLSALSWSFDDTVNYLQYHRDWLVRFFVPEPIARERFLDELKGLRPGEQFSGQIWRFFRRKHDATEQPSKFGRFVPSLVSLAAYASVFNDVPEFQIDPFAVKAAFLPVFKVLHGVANQLGLPPLEEGRIYDVLLAALVSRGQPMVAGA